MDVTPQLLRDTEFREQRKGYDPVEVREFLGRLADAVGRLQDELQAAVARADRAERRLLDSSPEGDQLSRTLVLAQRTADAVLEEARGRAAEVEAEAQARASALTSEAETRAATVTSEAETRAATLTSEAEAAATAATGAATERATSLVAGAEERVATELVPLLEQREALQRDVDALRSWAAAVRAKVADELRQQLAWLEGDGPELPPAPGVTDIELPEPTVVTVPPAEEGAPGAGGADREQAGAPAAVGDATPVVDLAVEEAAPAASATGGAGAGAGDEALAEPEPTGVLDLRDLEDDRPGSDRGALASAAADDPFLAELRRAVTDDEPLGPRERVVVDPGGDDLHDDDDLLGPTSVFRRRKRR